jgi:hypothetical protein
MPILISLIASAVLKYFWFGIILVGAANAWVIQKRARPLIEKFPALQADANKVSITLILLIGIPSAMLGIIQLMAGYESPFYIFDDDLTNPYLLAAWITMAALRIFILYWIWFTKGLESYLAVTPITIKKPRFLSNIAGILIVRWVVTGILATWFISVVISFL